MCGCGRAWSLEVGLALRLTLNSSWPASFLAEDGFLSLAIRRIPANTLAATPVGVLRDRLQTRRASLWFRGSEAPVRRACLRSDDERANAVTSMLMMPLWCPWPFPQGHKIQYFSTEVKFT